MRTTKRIISAVAIALVGSLTLGELGGAYAYTGESASQDSQITEYACKGEMYDALYISKDAYNTLPEDAKEAYDDLCGEVGFLYENGAEPEDIVFATDENGDLYVKYFIPYNAAAGLGEEILSDIETDLNDVSYNDGESENPSEEDDADDVSEKPGEESADEPSEEDIIEEPVDEVIESEITEESISENMEYFSDFILEEDEEEFTGEDNTYDTLISYYNEDYFLSQLDSFGAEVYAKGKTDFVKKSKSYIKFQSKVNFNTRKEYASTEICKAMSALMTMYPAKFNWMDTGTGGITITAKYAERKWNYKVSLKKSDYFTDKLQASAEKKVASVVKKAYEYAQTRYHASENNIVYGIVEYIDKWVCENNEYKSEYANPSEESVLATKAYYYSHNPYGTLLYGYGVCEGYAKTTSWLLDAAGITNIYVVSGSHAYVYVMMNDDKWYLLDTMADDAGETTDRSHFLKKVNLASEYASTGAIFGTEDSDTFALEYPELSDSDVADVSGEDIALNKYKVAISKGKTSTISVGNAYYNDFKKKWTTSKKSVATVDETGKVTAVSEGTAQIKCTIAGNEALADVFVYKFSGIVFDSNNKSTLSAKYENNGAYTISGGKVSFEGSEYLTLTVKQTNKVATATELYLYDSKLSLPTVTSSNKSVATVEFVGETGLSGDNIRIHVTPLSPGKTTITVKFGGKTAKLTYTVTQKLQDEWFGSLPYENKTYTGEAFTPKLKTNKSVTRPSALTESVGYTIKYSNNKNAGTATVTAVGKGLFSGTVTRTFEIKPIEIGFKGKYTCSEAKTFNGSERAAKTEVTYKDKTLKKNRDYIVKYKLNGQNKYYTTAPVNKGVYTILIEGIGNYSGTLRTTTYEIKQLSASKLKLSCSSSIRYANGEVVKPTIKLLYDDLVIPEKTNTEYTNAVNYTVKYQYKQADGKYKNVDAPTIVGTYKVIVTVNNININTAVSKDTVKNTFEKTFTVK